MDTALSRRTSEHLHHERLPYVDAQVLRGDRGEANSVVLTGQVHTAFGKQDAERKVRAFLGEYPLAIKNQISVVGEIPEHPKASASQNEIDLNMPSSVAGAAPMRGMTQNDGWVLVDEWFAYR